jgi:hypothetical protein
MILASFAKKSSKDFPLHMQFALASKDQFFMKMTSLSKFSTPSLQQRRLVKIIAILNILRIPKNQPCNKGYVGKLQFMALPPS